MRILAFIFTLFCSVSLYSQDSLRLDSIEYQLFKLEQRINTLEFFATEKPGRDVAMSGMELHSSINQDLGLELSPDHGSLVNHSLWLSISILIFGTIIIGGAIIVMARLKKGWGPNAIQLVGIILIIVSSIFLITAGYSEKQITPVIGLLGTIAGYLLGRTNQSSINNGS